MEQMQQQPRLAVPARRRYGPIRRAVYGGLWSFYTFVIVLAVINGFAHSEWGQSLLALVLAFFTGWYAYRIWTWRARVLWVLLFF